MRRWSIVVGLVVSLGSGGCETEPSTAAGGSLVSGVKTRKGTRPSKDADDDRSAPLPSTPVPVPYPNVSQKSSAPSVVFRPEIDDEVIVGLQSGNYETRDGIAIVEVGERTVKLEDGQYETRSGKTFTIRNGRLLTDPKNQ